METNPQKQRLIVAWQHGAVGGAQIYLMGIAKKLKSSFDCLFLVPTDSPRTTLDYLDECGLAHRGLDLGNELRDAFGLKEKLLRHAEKMVSDFRFVRQVLRNSNPSDVVHVELTPWQSVTALTIIALSRNAFCTVHNRVSPSKLRGLLWRFKFHLLGWLTGIRIFATNRDAKDFVDSLSPVSLRSRVFVVPTTADLELADQVLVQRDRTRSEVRKSLGLSESEQVVLTVGQFIDRKGRRTLLDVIPEIRGRIPNIKFLWFSDSVIEPEFIERISKISEIRIVSPSQFGRSRIDVFRLITAADLFVLPSLVEGLPIALLEAMAMGTPCISTNVNGIPEAIVHLETGILIAPGSAHELKEAIITLLSDNALAERLASQGKRLVQEAFDEAKVAKTAGDRYLESLSPQRGTQQ